MKEHSSIIIHNTYNNIGKLEKQEYVWEGDSRFVFMNINFILGLGYKEVPRELILGQYKLSFVGIDYSSGLFEFVKKDSFYKFFIFQNRLVKTLDLAYRRLIITLAVWNLADIQQETIPTWRDVKVFKKI